MKYNINKLTDEEFSQLLEKKLEEQPKEGVIKKGKIINLTDDLVFVEVGLKSEGRIPRSEFAEHEEKVSELSLGDEVEVYIEKIEDKSGSTRISRDKVAKEEAWNKFEELLKTGDSISGKIIGKVNKGGFAVDISDIYAFLPGSQLDVKQIKDTQSLIGIEQPFKVLKVDRAQGNVVVSRKAIMEEARKEAREDLLSTIKEGMILKGTVKNITNYGAFIDLGYIDGLLHIVDISWDKLSHPSERLSIGQELEVMVTKYNAEAQRVSLGLKQLTDNPWKGIESKYSPGTKHKGTIVSVSDYGVFVELEKNIEGLVYLNEIDWYIKNTHPTKLVKIGDEVDVLVLDIDISRHRISLSIKRCLDNPWKNFVDKYPIGTEIEAEIKKVADFGLFVSIPGEELTLLVPAIEINHDDNPKEALKQFKVGDKIRGVVLNSDFERERVTISIKRLQENKMKNTIKELTNLYAVTAKVIEVRKDGILAELEDGVQGFIKKYDLSRHKDQQNPERFTLNDRIDVKVLSYDKQTKLLNLSVKAVEIADEKKAIKEYGSTNSGASLGDILGAVIEKNNAYSSKDNDEKS